MRYNDPINKFNSRATTCYIMTEWPLGNICIQEALYNLARAYQHVGLITIAATYYEKVLAIHQKDYPIPKLPNDGTEVTSDLKPGYCDLRREAAYNLHLIYKSSGSVDLARQVLKDHCSL